MKVETKRLREQKVINEMIAIYCRKNHKTPNNKLCEDCQKLLDYANERTKRCPFMEDKTFCVNCKVHCYKPEMRTKIRKVMRFSGPRIALYHPILAIWHLISSNQEKCKQKIASNK